MGKRVIALLILAALAVSAQAQGEERQRYVVLLEEPSVADRVLASGIAVTAGLRRSLATDPNWTGYRSQLLSRQQALISTLAGSSGGANSLRTPGLRVLAGRALLINVLVVEAGEGDRARLEAQPGVGRVVAIEQREPLLDAAPLLLNAPVAWEELGGAAEAGRGVRIGIIDSGINQNHPMFDDSDLQYPPGFPLPGQDLNFVNRKVIVARSYHDLFPNPQDNETPEDELSHGTRVASVAAGRQAAAPLGDVSGVAPMAWLGSYKVFGTPGINPTATNASITLALNDAVADGMDVINLSLGGTARPPATDPEQLAIRAASQLGVIVVISAGNSGPGPGTVKSPGTSPEAITVGAVSNARAFRATLQVLSSPQPPAELAQVGYIAGSGVTINTPIGPSPLASAAGLDPTEQACSPLAPGALTGRVVLVRRGGCTFQTKADNSFGAGAAALIIYNDRPGEGPIFMTFGAGAGGAAVMIGNLEGEALRDWIGTVPSTVQIGASTDLAAVSAQPDLLTSFSSRGPSVIDEVKPDVSAVGQGIYSASNDGISYRMNSNGTSFSAPLTAGAAALLRQMQPDWPTAWIKSVLVNSAARTTIWNGEIASVNQSGAGRLDLDRALDARVAADPVSLSFGFLEGPHLGAVQQRTVRIQNLTSQAQSVSLEYEPLRGADAVTVELPQSFAVLGPQADIDLAVEVSAILPADSTTFEGLLHLSQDNGLRLAVPVWGGLIVPDFATRLEVGPAGPFFSLESALAIARPGNVIAVEGGPFSVNLELGINAFELPHDHVTIAGAGSQRPVLEALSSDDPVIDIRNVEDFRLEGLHLKGGDRSVEVTDSSGFIVDSLLEDTFSSSLGIDALRSRVGVVDSRIRDVNGSAIAFFDSAGLVSGSVVGTEAAPNQRYGIFASGADIAVFDSVFRHNNASGGTAAFLGRSTRALLKGSVFEEPAAGPRDGVGVDGIGAHVELYDSLIRDNTRNGLSVSNNAAVVMARTRIEDHPAGSAVSVSSGASVLGRSVWLERGVSGVFSADAVIDLRSSVIAGFNGDGVMALNSSLKLGNLTIADNGGVGLRLLAANSAEVSNSIFFGNFAGDLSGADPGSFFFNLIGDGQFAGVNSNLAGDPAFEAGGDNVFALMAQSPAIDSGDDARVTVTTDVNSHLRIADGDGDSVSRVDRGAAEFASDFGAPIIVPVLTAEAGRFSGLAFTNASTPPLGLDPAANSAGQAPLRLRGFDSDGQLLGQQDLNVEAGRQLAVLAEEVFAAAPAWIEVTSADPDLMGFTLLGDFDLSLMDGAQLAAPPSDRLIFPEISDGETILRIVNPSEGPVWLTLTHDSGAQVMRQLAPFGALSAPVSELFQGVDAGYIEVASDPPRPLAGLETFGDDRSVGGLWALDGAGGSAELFAAHFVTGPAVSTTLNVINIGAADSVLFEAFDEQGALLAAFETQLESGAQLREAVAVLFDLGEFEGTGWIRISTSSAALTGALRFEGRDGGFLAVLPLQSAGARESVFSHVAHSDRIFTGVTLLNPTDEAALLVLEVFDRDGIRVGRAVHQLPPGRKVARLMDEWIPGFASQLEGFVRVRSATPLLGFELFGGWALEFLAAVPQQKVIP